ncbi:transmembrane sensor [Parabacteroides sp. PF5-5]|nr:transmembrane sensor [Parabacteroides sp. PH5-39]MDH6316704.1 transmembrane sensor [Parabacteroides sp. PF5-13]MDH6320116.1 transmembrane sensor [Parabacteroides sp. PH5-13]MDH6323941.1 transmembrane sensor [Parabacteroides sp. PH5-8]MDH6327793.1 transmembrane sensor [Parabacteroides sp. PH5-41]MDH6335691.1 transmembrane sensor [Parabacteroides sp. PF5-5]MDH6346657.1 transmembrane sensor [Parabacteroides sp. PH5-46]MDH6361717.1 transmembrane sensor [Parabacteroides sp. PH5-16]MDH6377384.
MQIKPNFRLNEKPLSLLLSIMTDKENKHKTLHEWLEQIDLSPQVTAMGEDIKEPVLKQLNQRIDKAKRRSLWIKMASVAASILLLLGVTNYVSFQQGYNKLNSQFVEMKNPLGMLSSIELSDGTKVTLNAGTILKYPTAFTDKDRIVEVDGEAYFEVVHNKKQPFIVKADNINVRVLGTKFNVKAYKEEKNIEVTLEEGSIEVGLNNQKKYIRVDPGQQVLYDKFRNIFQKKQVDLNYYTAWREGKFYFNSMTFEDIARQLERHFNVHISISPDRLKEIIYTGDFVRQENLEQILRVMTADKRTYYQIDGDFIQIYDKK